ncbi:MAG TPA: hypothetical protein VGW38_11405 [Chloroflexota bacterium]|nr:hypothetical protein [Chloroflexota bacterium]
MIPGTPSRPVRAAMRMVCTFAGALAVAMAVGAGLNTQAWECGAVGDQFLGGIEHWGPGVVLPAVVGAVLLSRARRPVGGSDIGLVLVWLPLGVYAGITWVASICSIG